MGKLTYTMLTSADGYAVGPDGSFDWATPTPEVHRHANGLERAVSREILGARMWEVMSWWEDFAPDADAPQDEMTDAAVEFAEIWRAIPKTVFSHATGNPFDAEVVRELVEASEGIVSISGPTIAAVALREGLVDEVAHYVVPVVVGGGTPWWPLGLEARLELLEEQNFDEGWIYLRYRVLR